MSENNPQPESFDDELLSAYVDGELTGEQLAQVEQRLADDPQSQQLVDELRELSAGLQAMPRLAVGDDLRSDVLRQAEQAMLLGGKDPCATLPDAMSDAGPTVADTNTTSPARRWIWAVAALAATVMLSLVLPATDQGEDLKVAEAKSERAKSTPVENQKTKKSLPLSEKSGADSAFDFMPSEESPDDEVSNEVFDDMASNNGAEAPVAFAAETKPSNLRREERAVADIAADKDTVTLGVLEAEGRPGEGAPREAESMLASDAAAGADEIAANFSVANSPGNALALARSSAVQVDAASLADVHFACEVHLTFNNSPDNFERFDQTMLQNKIVIENESGEEPASTRSVGRGGGLGGELATRARGNDKFESGNEQAGENFGAASSAQSFSLNTRVPRGQRRELEKGKRVVQEELVLVELPAEQLEQLLSDLKADRGNYHSISIVAGNDALKTAETDRIKQDEKAEEVGQVTQQAMIDGLQQYTLQATEIEAKEIQGLQNRAGKMFARSRQAPLQSSLSQQDFSQQGRALRLNSQQYQYAGDGVLNVDQSWLNKNFQSKQILGKRIKNKLAKAASTIASSSSQIPIQVLIILQQPILANSPKDLPKAPPKDPPGEPASAGGESTPSPQPNPKP